MSWIPCKMHNIFMLLTLPSLQSCRMDQWRGMGVLFNGFLQSKTGSEISNRFRPLMFCDPLGWIADSRPRLCMRVVPLPIWCWQLCRSIWWWQLCRSIWWWQLCNPGPLQKWGLAFRGCPVRSDPCSWGPAVPTASGSWRRAWRRVGKAEVNMGVDAKVVEEKLEEREEEEVEDEEEEAEEENNCDKI